MSNPAGLVVQEESYQDIVPGAFFFLQVLSTRLSSQLQWGKWNTPEQPLLILQNKKYFL